MCEYNALVRALHLIKQPPKAFEVNKANELRSKGRAFIDRLKNNFLQ